MSDAAECTIRKHLRLVLDAAGPIRRSSRPLPAPAAFLVRHGRMWTSAPLPSGIPSGTRGECYRNAFRLATEHPGLSYAEGIALDPHLGVPLEHAWCVDTARKVVDPTWERPECGSYYGVAFDLPTLNRIALNTRIYGVFGMGEWKAAAELLASDQQFASFFSEMR